MRILRRDHWAQRIVAVILALLAGMAAAVFAREPTETATSIDDDYPRAALPDAISGHDLCLVEARVRRATVFFCMSTDCPISNEYVPTIVAIAEAFSERGVSFVGINPNGGQTLETMAAYVRENKVPFPFVKDEGGKVSRRLLFSVTPEARVFDAQGQLVYSGRIDDRYRRGGASDANVAKDLEQALEEVLAGKQVQRFAPPKQSDARYKLPSRDRQTNAGKLTPNHRRRAGASGHRNQAEYCVVVAYAAGNDHHVPSGMKIGHAFILDQEQRPNRVKDAAQGDPPQDVRGHSLHNRLDGYDGQPA